MARWSVGLRCLLLLAAIAFIYTQLRLLKAQSEYAEKISAAVEGENHCTSQMQLLIHQISMQKEKIVVLEEKTKQQEEEREQLRTLVQNLERKDVKNLFQQDQDG